MVFDPKYTVTNTLLANIKRIGSLVTELNNKKFPNIVLFELEREAREVSSHASTSIEGNPLLLTEVKKVLENSPKNLRRSEQEVLNYNKALEMLTSETLNIDLVLKIHKHVMSNLLALYQIGQFRTEPVVVHIPKTGEIIYLPPSSEDVKPLVTELVDFTKNQKGNIDPLIIAGVFHKQFEIIHPFIDGNGRTGRLATTILLKDMGLDTFNLFSFENYYNQNVTRYFEKVGVKGDYPNLEGKVDFTDWLEYFTEGLIDELLRVQKILSTKTITPESELQQHDKIIIKFIEEKGFIRDSDYKNLTNRAKATRTLDFQNLIKKGLITRAGAGKATYYKFK